MTPDQFNRRQREKIEKLKANRESDCTRIVLDLIAQVRLRVQTQGDDYLGRNFEPYTPQYARQRAKAGYQVDQFDFTRTGRAWASVRPETIKVTDNSVVIEAAPRTEQNRLKFRGNARKRGNIIEPSDDEIEIARESNRRRILKYIR